MFFCMVMVMLLSGLLQLGAWYGYLCVKKVRCQTLPGIIFDHVVTRYTAVT